MPKAEVFDLQRWGVVSGAASVADMRDLNLFAALLLADLFCRKFPSANTATPIIGRSGFEFPVLAVRAPGQNQLTAALWALSPTHRLPICLEDLSQTSAGLMT
jgi:hypothetical protein